MVKKLISFFISMSVLLAVFGAFADQNQGYDPPKISSVQVKSGKTIVTFDRDMSEAAWSAYYTVDGKQIILSGEWSFLPIEFKGYGYTYNLSDKSVVEIGKEDSQSGTSTFEIYEGSKMTSVYTSQNTWASSSWAIFSPQGLLYDAGYTDKRTGTYYQYKGGVWTSTDASGHKVQLSEAPAGFDEESMYEIWKKFNREELRPNWYPNNTAGVIGISLRDHYPGLTKKWYHVVPVDVSREGLQSFPMVASNLFYMGNVNVLIEGDNITTTYDYGGKSWYQIYPKDECLAWFTGVDEIQSSFLENPVSDFRFGEPVSREKDLHGQKYALLFVCNHLTYHIPFDKAGHWPTRFWPNSSRNEAYFSSAHTMLRLLETEHAHRLSENAEEAESTETHLP